MNPAAQLVMLRLIASLIAGAAGAPDAGAVDAAAPPVATGPVVELKFAWPARLRCDVERKTAVSVLDGIKKIDTSHRVRWDVRRTPRGFDVRQTFLSATYGRPSDTPILKLTFPDFEVGPGGTFIDVAYTPEQKAALRAEVERRKEAARTGKGPPDPVPDLEQENSRRTARDWRELVEHWNGGELEPGVPWTTTTELDSDIPMLGRVHSEGQSTWTLERGVPCAHLPRGGCVQIRVVSDPRLQSSGGQAPTIGDAQDGPGPGAAFDASKVRMHVVDTLVTDPRTLIPRSHTHAVDLELPGGAMGALPKAFGLRIHVDETTTLRCDH